MEAASFQLMVADSATIDCSYVWIAVELVADVLDFRFDCGLATTVDSNVATLQEAEIVSKTIQTTNLSLNDHQVFPLLTLHPFEVERVDEAGMALLATAVTW